MTFNVITSPTKTFEDAFHNPRIGFSAVVVLFTAFLMALSSFIFLFDYSLAVYFFIAAIIQWVVFTVIVWFFEFVHVRKRKQLLGNSFSQISSVTAKLWTINLFAGVLTLVLAFVAPLVNNLFSLIVLIVILVLMIVLFIGWIIASIKMLKVITDAKGWRLVINWLILVIINSVVFSFLNLVLTRVIPF